MDAGERLFAVHAMDVVTIDHIVDAADVAKGSFYNHFADKTELVQVIITQVQSECEDQIAHANQGVTDAAERIVRAFCIMIRYAQTHPERLQALLSLSERGTIKNTPLNTGVARDIERGLETKRFGGITIEAGIIIVIGIVRLAVGHMIAQPSDGSVSDLAVMIGAAELRALGCPDPDSAVLAHAAAHDILTLGTKI